MEQLLRSPAAHHAHPHPNPQHSFFRSTSSTLQHQHSDIADAQSEGSECCTGQPTPARISLAKKLLAAAADRYPPTLAWRVGGNGAAPGRNGGALGSLLAMIQSETESEATRHDALETLNFMLLDRANRKAVLEGAGLDTLLALLASPAGPATQCSALEAVATLIKGENSLKERVWAHPSSQAILSLVSLSLPSPQLGNVLCHLRKIAFLSLPGSMSSCGVGAGTGHHPPSPIRGAAHPAEVLHSGVLLAVANILVPALPRTPLSKALRLLRMAADTASPTHLRAWHLVLFRLVPLLQSAVALEAVLEIMLCLAEHAWCKNAFMAAGALPPLLSLLVCPPPSQPPAAITCACVLSLLSEGPGLSRDYLAREASLRALVRALQATWQPEVAIAILYALNRLVLSKPEAGAWLRALGVPALVAALMAGRAAAGSHPAVPGPTAITLGAASGFVWAEDMDLMLGAQQLLETLAAGAASETVSPLAAATAILRTARAGPVPFSPLVSEPLHAPVALAPPEVLVDCSASPGTSEVISTDLESCEPDAPRARTTTCATPSPPVLPPSAVAGLGMDVALGLGAPFLMAYASVDRALPSSGDMLPLPGYTRHSHSLRVDPTAPRTGSAVFQQSISSDLVVMGMPAAAHAKAAADPWAPAGIPGNASTAGPNPLETQSHLSSLSTGGQTLPTDPSCNSRTSSRESIQLSLSQLPLLSIAASVGGGGSGAALFGMPGLQERLHHVGSMGCMPAGAMAMGETRPMVLAAGRPGAQLSGTALHMDAMAH